jgi:hypothetical protein
MKLIKRDNIYFGLLVGLLLPAILFGLLYLVNDSLAVKTVSGEPPVSLSSIGLVAIFLNMFMMRLYLVSWKMEKTGRGILAMTFVLGIVFVLVLFK